MGPRDSGADVLRFGRYRIEIPVGKPSNTRPISTDTELLESSRLQIHANFTVFCDDLVGRLLDSKPFFRYNRG